jgi:hypothetical protein
MAIGQHGVEHPPGSAIDVIRTLTHPCVILIAHPPRPVMHDHQSPDRGERSLPPTGQASLPTAPHATTSSPISWVMTMGWAVWTGTSSRSGRRLAPGSRRPSALDAAPPGATTASAEPHAHCPLGSPSSCRPGRPSSSASPTQGQYGWYPRTVRLTAAPERAGGYSLWPLFRENATDEDREVAEVRPPGGHFASDTTTARCEVHRYKANATKRATTSSVRDA